MVDAGVQAAADVVVANLDQSAAFLDPRAHTLFIINYPDQSEYSPLYNGDSIYHLWYQLTQISDKMKRTTPSADHREPRDRKRDGTIISAIAVCDGHHPDRPPWPSLRVGHRVVDDVERVRQARAVPAPRSTTLNGTHHGAWNNSTILTISPL